MPLAESDLISRVLVDDDRHAFAELVRQNQSALRAFLRRLTRGDAALADDLAQETLVEAYRNLARFKGDARFSTWLCGIAYNRLRSELRKRREEPVDLTQDSAHQESLGAPDPRPSSELEQDLAAALCTLRPEEQAALQLCYREGLSHGEAASLLGCPVGTLKTHVLRAKQRLRHFLEAYA